MEKIAELVLEGMLMLLIGLGTLSCGSVGNSGENSQIMAEFNSPNGENCEIIINDKTFSAQLYDNETVDALREFLPQTYEMVDLNGNEKYCYLTSSLPAYSENVGRINAGDIMLYGSDCLVIFYESFDTSYEYTRIGKITNPNELAKLVGDGNISVEISIY